MISKILQVIIITGLLIIQLPLSAQDNSFDNVTRTNIRIDFSLTFSSLQLSLETWDNEEEPDSVKIEAYKRASGYLAGIPFHYERNRERMTIIEQVDEYADDLEYTGYRTVDAGYFEFDYTLELPSSIHNRATAGSSVQGHGSSDLEDLAPAREAARIDALKSAARAAIRAEFTEQNKPIPGIIDGRIMWYEVIADEVDSENGLYVYDIEAWVDLDSTRD